jgi:hypothetical protein
MSKVVQDPDCYVCDEAEDESRQKHPVESVDGIKRVDSAKFIPNAQRHASLKQSLVKISCTFAIFWTLLFHFEKTDQLSN